MTSGKSASGPDCNTGQKFPKSPESSEISQAVQGDKNNEMIAAQGVDWVPGEPSQVVVDLYEERSQPLELVDLPPQIIEQVNRQCNNAFRERGSDHQEQVSLSSEFGSAIGIDWLRFRCNHPKDYSPSHRYMSSKMAEVMARLNEFFPDCDFLPNRGQHSYELRLDDHKGIKVNYSVDAEEVNRKHFCVDISGDSCRRLTMEQMFEFCKFVARVADKVTRVDLAIDLFEPIEGFSLTAICDHLNAGNYSQFHKFSASSSNAGTEGLEHETIYLGSPRSGHGKFVRIYNKALEQRVNQKLGSLDPDLYWYRIETQLNDKFSDSFVKQLAKQLPDRPEPKVIEFVGEAEWKRGLAKWREKQAQIFREHLRAALLRSADFVEKKSKNLERCPRLPFWQRIVDQVEKMSLSTAPPKRDINQKMNWLRKQVSRTLLGVMLHFQEHSYEQFSSFEEWFESLMRGAWRELENESTTERNKFFSVFDISPEIEPDFSFGGKRG